MSFDEFKNTDPIPPPQRISESILALVQADLHPSAWKVFSKLSLIHFVSAAITLSMCPQFGLRLFGDGMGLMHYFMALGDAACMIACGWFFLGSTALLAAFFLTQEEVRCLRTHRIRELAALALMSLGFFFVMRAEIAIGFALLWLIGSIIGGLASLELGWAVRGKALPERI